MANINAKAERERMAEIKDELKSLKDSAEATERAFNEDEVQKWDALEQEYNACKERAETAERLARLPQEEEKPSKPHIYQPKREIITRSDVGKATKAFLTRNSSSFRDEYAEAAERCDFHWNSPSINVNLLANGETVKERSQTVGTVGKGGHGVSDEIVMGFEEGLKSFWSWSPYVTVHRTPTNGPYRIVTCDDSTSAAAYEAELGAIDNVDLNFGEAVFNSYKLTSGVFPVSNELLEDNEIGLGSFIGKALGTRIARKLASEITNGDGTSHLTGFTVDVATGVTTDSTSDFVEDDLIDLYFSIDDAYRQNAVWQMHSLTVAHISKMEDGQQRKIFGAGLNGSPQMTLLGKPIVVNDFLPVPTAGAYSTGAKPIYFGDFSHVHVRIVRDLSIRDSGEKYFVEDAKAFIGTLRADSKYVNAGTHPIKCLEIN